MILLLHTLPASLNYNITLAFMLSCVSIQIVTGIFLKMFYRFNLVKHFQKNMFSKEQFFSSSIFILPSFDKDSWLPYLLIIIILLLVTYFWKKSTSIIIISLSIVVLLTTISLIFPLFSFIFTSLMLCVILLLLCPYKIYDSFFDNQKKIIRHFLIILHELNLLDFFATLYVLFFCVPTYIFKKRLLVMLIISILYVITTRYCFIHITLLHENFSNITYIFIYCLLFLGISLIFFRFLINFALFIVPLTLKTSPDLLSESILFVLSEEQDTSNPNPKDLTPESAKKKFSFININITRAVYRQHFTLNNTNSYKYFGIGIGLFTLGVTSYAAYYSKIQADTAIKQLHAQELNNQEMCRQNDLEEVSQGLMSKEDYIKKYKV